MTEQNDLNTAIANETAALRVLLCGVADILHSPSTGYSPLLAYGLTKSTHMKAAAKVLRHLAAEMRVREDAIREGKL